MPAGIFRLACPSFPWSLNASRPDSQLSPPPRPRPLAAVTGCTEKSDAGSGDAIQVNAADSKCETSSKSVPAGQVTLNIENKGSKATEVEILFPDDRIVSEKENIGPGTDHADRRGQGRFVRDSLPPA